MVPARAPTPDVTTWMLHAGSSMISPGANAWASRKEEVQGRNVLACLMDPDSLMNPDVTLDLHPDHTLTSSQDRSSDA